MGENGACLPLDLDYCHNGLLARNVIATIVAFFFSQRDVSVRATAVNDIFFLCNVTFNLIIIISFTVVRQDQLPDVAISSVSNVRRRETIPSGYRCLEGIAAFHPRKSRRP